MEVEKVDVNESNTLRSILAHDFTRKEFFQEIWQKQAKYFPLQPSFSSSVSSNGAWKDDEMNHHPLEETCLLYTSPSPRDRQKSRMPSSA